MEDNYMGKCSYINCKYGNCKSKKTCWTHEHTKNIIMWLKFMKMLKSSEVTEDILHD